MGNTEKIRGRYLGAPRENSILVPVAGILIVLIGIINSFIPTATSLPEAAVLVVAGVLVTFSNRRRQ